MGLPCEFVKPVDAPWQERQSSEALRQLVPARNTMTELKTTNLLKRISRNPTFPCNDPNPQPRATAKATKVGVLRSNCEFPPIKSRHMGQFGTSPRTSGHLGT